MKKTQMHLNTPDAEQGMDIRPLVSTNFHGGFSDIISTLQARALDICRYSAAYVSQNLTLENCAELAALSAALVLT